MAAKSLSEFVAPGAPRSACLGFQADFFATNQRELAFSRWMERNRPDIELVSTRFETVEDAGAVGRQLLLEHSDMAGLFVVWDTPAESVLSELSELKIPMTTVDLGKFSAKSLASGGSIVGIAGQHPFMQGVAAARTTISQAARSQNSRVDRDPRCPDQSRNGTGAVPVDMEDNCTAGYP